MTSQPPPEDESGKLDLTGPSHRRQRDLSRGWAGEQKRKHTFGSSMNLHVGGLLLWTHISAVTEIASVLLTHDNIASICTL